ncbi:MAG TPA: ATP-binding protein [Aquabacterium sp.]|nr:ATP-binding protein [Aquabacterium sp.]
MSAPPALPDESNRLATLHETRLLESSPPPALEALARLASVVLRCTGAAIHLVDDSHVRPIVSCLTDGATVPRAGTLCEQSILDGHPLLQSDGVAASPYATPHRLADGQLARACACHPLVVDGHALGTLCVLDAAPRSWTTADARLLADLAMQACALIEAELNHQRARKLAARVRTASLSGSDWLWETDRDGKLTWVSDSIYQHTGLMPHQELGRQAGTSYIPRQDETRSSWERLREALRNRQPFADAIAERETAVGRIVVSISGIPVHNRRGEFMGFRGACRNVTHQLQAQLELAQSEERWKFALEGSGDGVWDWDLISNRVFYSPRWKAMLGYADHEIQDSGDESLSRIHPDDREQVLESLRQYAAQGRGVFQGEYRIQHKDGHYLHVLSRGKVVSLTDSGSAQRIVGTQSDITLIKLAERNLHDKLLAEAASTAKSQFLSRMSHEMRTPLNAVSGFAQLLHRQLTQPDGDREQLNQVRQILHAARHLTGLVNDVLDLQQVETGMLNFRVEDISLREEVQRCVNLLTPTAEARQIDLIVDIPHHHHVAADRQRLSQIIMNLGSNAIKYNRKGGAVYFIAAGDADGMLILDIEDTGGGMTPDQLARLFQPFERLGRETSNIEGTGLGLIITRSLVEAMGGRLEICSQSGAGTRVSLILPRVLQPSLLIDADTGPTSPYTDSMMAPLMPESLPDDGLDTSAPSPLRVLYVEDNRINAMLFEEALRPYTHIELDIAEDGEMAVEAARERTPDVLVLDAHLPGMSGFEVLSVLRELPGLGQVPAYMCSADAMPEDVARAKQAGFTGYWTKPIDIGAVTTELCRLADRGDNPAS